MGAGQIEIINAPDMQIPVRREPTAETYLALEPPDALPYVVVPLESPIEDVVAFIQPRLATLNVLRAEMLKHYKKTRSVKCRFRTGDVAYLLGRPFMLRSNPLSSGRKTDRAKRTLASLQTSMNSEFSVIDLYVAQAGNYDQGKSAFMGFAKRVFSVNIKSLLSQCMGRVFPDVVAPTNVNCRPMRGAWVSIDRERDVAWFSESLIPYPPHAVVYAFLTEAIKHYAPEADEATYRELIERGVPNWQEMKALLADQNSRYAL